MLGLPVVRHLCRVQYDGDLSGQPDLFELFVLRVRLLVPRLQRGRRRDGQLRREPGVLVMLFVPHRLLRQQHVERLSLLHPDPRDGLLLGKRKYVRLRGDIARRSDRLPAPGRLQLGRHGRRRRFVHGHPGGLRHAHDVHDVRQSVRLHLDHLRVEHLHRHGADLQLAHDIERLLWPLRVQLVERNHLMCGRAHTVQPADRSVELRNAARLQLVDDGVRVHGNHHRVQRARDPGRLPYAARLPVAVTGLPSESAPRYTAPPSP